MGFPDSVAERRWAALLSAALVIATVALYAPVRQHEFIRFDDPEYVVENPVVRRGLTAAGVVWALTHFHSANWHPLTWVSHMVDVELFGLRAGPALLVNVGLHAATAVLLLLFLWRTTAALWPSAFVAALFALHPLRVESVAWVSERKDVLAALFWMLTLHAHVAWLRSPTAARRALVAAAFLLGLMAKPMLVTLPFALLLLDVWPLHRIKRLHDWRRWAVLLREKAPLFALSAASSLVTFAAQWKWGAVVPLVPGYGISYRLQKAVVAYAAYLVQTVWPEDLAAFYPSHTPIPLDHLLPAAALLVAITAAVAWLGSGRRYLWVGWLWYLGVLVPVIGIVWVGEQSRADRFTYLPQIGIGVMIAWSAREFLASRPRLRLPLAAAALAVLASWSATTRAQVGYWRDTPTLFRRALAVTRDNHVMHANLAGELAREGRVDEASRHYETALAIQPAFPKAHASLGAVLAEQGRVEEAMAHYEYALEATPESPLVRYNIGLALEALGREDEALEHLEAAVRLDPGYAVARVALAGALQRRGERERALAELRAAVEARPDLLAAHGNLAIALEDAGEPDEALLHYREAARLAPADVRTRLNLATVLAARGEYAEALAEVREAERLEPASEAVRSLRAEIEAARAAGGAE